MEKLENGQKSTDIPNSAGQLQSPELRGGGVRIVTLLHNAARVVIPWLLVAAITLGGIELGLRLLPNVIPLGLLEEFQENVRLTIAQRLHLQNYSQVWTFPRDDGGPALRLFKPFATLDFNFRDIQEYVPIRLDAQGFCNPPENSYDAPQIDIIVVGDSFTWCFGLDPPATWGSRLGAFTGRSSYTIGRGNTGPYEYLQLLKRFGLPKRPKFVVFNIYEGNDLRDSVLYHKYVKARVAGEVLYADPADPKSGPPIYNTLLNNVLGRHSYAMNFLVTGLGRGYGLVKNAILPALGGTVPAKINFRYRLNFAAGAVPFNLYNADRDEVRYAQWLRIGTISLADFTDALTQFVALSRAHGFTPVVSYSPSAYTAYADFVEFEDPALSDLMPWYSRTQREFFRSKADELGYIFVDITPYLQAAARAFQGKTLIYYPGNVHFTATGNKVVAEALAAVITGQTTGTMR